MTTAGHRSQPVMGATRHLAKNGGPRCDCPLWNAGVRNLLSLASLVTMRKSSNTNCRYGAVSRQASVYSGQSLACLEWENVCGGRMVHFPIQPAPIRRHAPVRGALGNSRDLMAAGRVGADVKPLRISSGSGRRVTVRSAQCARDTLRIGYEWTRMALEWVSAQASVTPRTGPGKRMPWSGSEGVGADERSDSGRRCQAWSGRA
jgi:hypothetical protein